MGKMQETVNFHKRIKNHQLVDKKIPYPHHNHHNQCQNHQQPGAAPPPTKAPPRAKRGDSVDPEELVGTTQEKRNWRGIIIALLVILTVLALIVTAIILVTPKVEDEKLGAKLDFRSFLKDDYEPKQFFPIWQGGPDDSFIYYDRNAGISMVDCAKNSSTIFVDNHNFKRLNTDIFTISADQKFILYVHKIEKVYRYSNIASYTAVNVKTRETFDIKGPHGDRLQYAKWSSKDHSLLFAQYNDIFFMKDVETGLYDQLTHDGIGDTEHIFNGVPDWVYEEEILHADNAAWFSPDGEHLVYARFDDRDVMTYEMTVFGNEENEYVMAKTLAYPKPGTPNPKVQLKTVDLTRNVTRDLAPPVEFQFNTEHYFMYATWKDDTHVLICWLSRLQTVAIFSLCDVTDATCKETLKAEGDGGWIDVSQQARFSPDGSNYFILLPHRDGEAGSFQHISMVSSSNDLKAKPGEGSKIFLTAGQWDVSHIVGISPTSGLIYFIATPMGNPKRRHLYSTTTVKDHEDFQTAPTCLSCDWDPECQYVDARFSPSADHYILSCKGPGVPSFHLFAVDNGHVAVLEDNAELRKRMDTMQMPVEESGEIPMDEDKTGFSKMYYKALLPPILKKDEIIKYNILFQVYGSPGTQIVTEEFRIGWDHYLCSVHSIIIVYVDGRGTGGRGNKWLHANYKELGTLEVDDIIAAAHHFNQKHYVNEPAGIWGLSHGGFLASAVLGRGSPEFNCGLAVAAVTDWRYYDSVYTERYMGYPSENLVGYNAASVPRNAKNFKSSKFMLIHGTQDDNVHFQNSAQLMKALVDEDVYFRQQIYPDQNHFLNGGNTKTHFYNTMEDFILHCYGKPRVIDDYDSDTEKDIDAEE